MPTPPLTDEKLRAAVEAVERHGSQVAAASALKLSRQALQNRLKRAAEQGLMGYEPILPGFAAKSISSRAPDGAWVKQTKAPGEVFELPARHSVKGVSALIDGEDRVIQKWVKTDRDSTAQYEALRAAFEAFKEELPREAPVAAPVHVMGAMLSQYTITDAHLGAMAWNEETGRGDYDLAIGEKLLVDWFGAAIAGSPPSRRAVLAQLGDFLHHDSFKSVTPEHGHVLDADSRYPKMVRVAIRVLRRIVRMLLEKHAEVHLVMADANHDPVSGVWLRELFAVLYEDEPRVTVDTTPGTYSVLEHGDVSLFWHHGHRRGVSDVDSVFAGKFREIYGRTRFSYAHLGHKHADELKTTNLMKVEQHETLAAPDAFAANGGWLSGRSAKVIYYHAKRGEVGRNVITPEMVADGGGE